MPVCYHINECHLRHLPFSEILETILKWKYGHNSVIQFGMRNTDYFANDNQ